MNIATALLLAANLLSSGVKTTIVRDPGNTAVVFVDGRPGCTAEAQFNDPSRPIIVCRGVGRR